LARRDPDTRGGAHPARYHPDHADDALGPDASPALIATADERNRDLAMLEGAEWAREHAPSTVDAADYIRRALAGELFAFGAVFEWRALGFGRWLLKQHPAVAGLGRFAKGPMI
jgi:hypothetical protein